MLKKRLRRYLALNVLAMVGISCYILADTFFISLAEGANGITALNLTLPIYGLLFAIGSMIGIGSAIRYALCKASAQKEADFYFSNAIVWELILSIPFVLAGVLIPDTVLRLMGADEEILQTGVSYLRIAMCCAPFFMCNYVFTSFARNDNAPNIAMAATLCSSLFNILFDYLLMFVFDMGMVGAALATGISPAVSMAICCIHYFSKKNTIVFRLQMPSVRYLLLSCRLGVVAFVGEIASGITTMVFNYILLALAGNIAVAAYGIIANIALVGTAIFNGVSQGLQPMASEAHGSAQKKEQKQICLYALKVSLILSIILLALIWIFADAFVAIFNSEASAEMAAYAVPGIRIYFLGFLIASINLVMAGYYSATDRAWEASVSALSRGVVAISIFAVILSKLFGIVGVWMAFPAAELFTLGLLLVMRRFFRYKK